MAKTDYLVICVIIISLGLFVNNNRIDAMERIYSRDSSFQITDPLAKDVLVNKTFYLSRDFSPYDLIKPDINHLIPGDINRNKLRFEAAFMLENLYKKSKQDNILLYSVSGYRSYDRQERIFMANALDNGFEEANQISALSGESEHQTGLAIDLTSAEVNFRLSSEFGATEAGKWLAENAHYFGFIIRYPKEKTVITGYNYEPWHLRYVGVEDAINIVESEITYEDYYFSNKITLLTKDRLNYNEHYQSLYENFAPRYDWDYKAEEEEVMEELEEVEESELEESAEEDEKKLEEEKDEDNEIRISF